jgi:hypothetical protein
MGRCFGSGIVAPSGGDDASIVGRRQLGARQHQCGEVAGAGCAHARRGMVQRGAAGHHVVHQHHPPAAHPAASSGSTAKASRRLCWRSHATAWPGARCRAGAAAPGIGLGRCQLAAQQQRLVETALPQPGLRQRHRQQQVGRLQRGLHPGGAAHQQRKGCGPSRPAPELELGDQPRPGIGVRHGRHAGIQHRRLAHAARCTAGCRPAPAARRSRSGAGVARTAPRRHRTPAAPARRGRRRTGSGGAVGQPLQQLAEHALNILAALHPLNHVSRPTLPRWTRRRRALEPAGARRVALAA